MVGALSIKPTYVKLHIDAQQTDFAYWQAQPYESRLATVEEIRKEFHRWKYGAEPRLQRVCSIAKR
jgi:hypothetical protein